MSFFDQMSDSTKFILLLAGVVLIIYFLNSDTTPIHNDGALENKSSSSAQSTQSTRTNNTRASTNINNSTRDKEEESDGESMDSMNYKFNSKNRSYDGRYKSASYAEGSRGNGGSDLDSLFSVDNDLVSGSLRDNDEFVGMDESGDKLAGYKPGKRRELSDEEIFNADDYLPKEESKDWFEVMPEPIQSKNRHLISVTRPIGVNTVGTSLKNASYDIRGCPPNPKMVISPFLNSSIEADYNTKGFCN
jgi:hypothetical protein